MNKAELVGKRFGRLLVVSEAPRRNGRIAWKCLCDCGKHKITNTTNLTSGDAKSCGCIRVERATKMRKDAATHGMTKSPEFGTWLAIIKRCTNPKHKSWEHYGARGIKICEEWLNSFEAFFKHVGHKPSPNYSIDRIDVNGNYEPGNVRWIPMSEQAKNRRPFKIGVPKIKALGEE